MPRAFRAPSQFLRRRSTGSGATAWTYRWDQRHERRGPSHVAAGFESLRDDRVDAGRSSRFRFLHRAHLGEHADARALHLFDVRRNVAPEEEQHRHALLDASVHLAAFQQRKKQPCPEWLRRTSARVANLLANDARRNAAHAEKAEASGFGDRSSELGSGHASTERRGEDRMLDRTDRGRDASSACRLPDRLAIVFCSQVRHHFPEERSAARRALMSA